MSSRQARDELFRALPVRGYLSTLRPLLETSQFRPLLVLSSNSPLKSTRIVPFSPGPPPLRSFSSKFGPWDFHASDGATIRNEGFPYWFAYSSSASPFFLAKGDRSQGDGQKVCRTCSTDHFPQYLVLLFPFLFFPSSSLRTIINPVRVQ
ncbi:hypothetical protein VTL71DRAFT_3513 [Oculimacula yallundae]|uniref:Uncharacterized protein n=1 Tax=Oculimacula yallundae TaxID=86028 RepID=A0ABR4C9J0_9HELO